MDLQVFTPGLTFVGRALLSLLFPCTFIAGVQYILNNQFDIIIPTWFLITVALIGLPVVMAIRVGIDEIKQRRKATAMGARMLPRVSGKWPGNVDLVVRQLENWRNGYPADGFIEWIHKLGSTFDFHALWEDIVFTTEPDHIKIVLTTDFPNFVKGDKFRHSMASVLGTGVFNSDGDMWKFHRSITRPFFSRDRITEFDNFERHADDVIGQMKERFRAGYAVDFQDVISRFTLDSASEFLFGHDVKSLSSGLPYPHNVSSVGAAQPTAAEDFTVAFAKSQYIIATRSRLGSIWPLFEIFQDKTAEPMKVVNSFLDPILRAAVEKHQSKPGSLQERKDEVQDDETLLDHLIKVTNDRTVLKDEILNILIAGRDTTAATLTFVIYFLSTNPKVLARLREEVLVKVGPSAKPTFDNIRDMKYLRAVINETLRLFPAVPFDVRECVHETTWPSQNPLDKPLYIPAKASVCYSAFMMHRRTDLWGPDALEFDPDRFLDERVKKYLTNNPFIFLPFNAGPRICVGQQFAYNEMSFMLICLLQNFSSMDLDFDAQPPETRPPELWATAEGRKSIEKVWPKTHLTMYAHGGLWVKMGEA